MSGLRAVCVRELRGAYRGPVGFVVLAAFLALHGLFFLQILQQFSDASLVQATSGHPDPDLNFTTRVLPSLVQGDAFALLLLLPALAMGSFASEWRGGTGQLLLSWPLRERELVLGKWLAGVVQLTLMLLLALPLPLLVSTWATVQWPVLATAWLGLWLHGCAILAVASWLSSITQNQVVAFAASLALLLGLMLLGGSAGRVGPPWDGLLRHFSFNAHLAHFGYGLVRLSSVAYYGSLVVLALYLAAGSVAARRDGGSA